MIVKTVTVKLRNKTETKKTTSNLGQRQAWGRLAP